MRVRSVVSIHPPVTFNWAVLDSHPEKLEFDPDRDIFTHTTVLNIAYAQGCVLSRVVAFISCCPNLRSLEVVRFLTEEVSGYLASPSATRLHLPHLRRLVIDPCLPAPFTALLLSSCPNLEVLAFTLPPYDLRPDELPQWIDHSPRPSFPNLRVLGIGNWSPEWINSQLNLQQSPRLAKIAAVFRPGDNLVHLTNTRSLRSMIVLIASTILDDNRWA